MHINTSASPRQLSVVEDVGASAHLVQVKSLLAARLHVGQPTVVLVLAGRQTVYGEEGCCTANAGDIMLLPSGAAYSVSNEIADHGRFEALSLFFDQALLHHVSISVSLFAPVVRAKVLPQVTEEFRHAVLRANDLMQKGAAPVAIVRHALIEVLTWMQATGNYFAPIRLESFVERLRIILSRNPQDSWTAALGAAALNVSEATLRRRLACERWSMSALLLEVRLAHAMKLLQSSGDYVGKIAFDAGFINHAHFSRLFKKRFGITPTQLRRSDRSAA